MFNLDDMLVWGVVCFNYCYVQFICVFICIKLLSGWYNVWYFDLDSFDVYFILASIFFKVGYQIGVIGKWYKVYIG